MKRHQNYNLMPFYCVCQGCEKKAFNQDKTGAPVLNTGVFLEAGSVEHYGLLKEELFAEHTAAYRRI